MALTPEEMSLRGKVAAHTMWAGVADRTERTAPARAAFESRFEKQVDPDGVMTPEARRMAAESARKAYYARLAFRSAQARKRRAGLPTVDTEAAAS